MSVVIAMVAGASMWWFTLQTLIILCCYHLPPSHKFTVGAGHASLLLFSLGWASVKMQAGAFALAYLMGLVGFCIRWLIYLARASNEP